MPFGKKRDPRSGDLVHFDRLYAQVIHPAVIDAGLSPLRADEESPGGIFQKQLFERLVLSEYAIVDLSYANATLFYELGIRHARRPWSTVLLYRRDIPPTLDIPLDSALGYPVDLLDEPAEAARMRDQLTRRLLSAKGGSTDSPFFQLVTGLPMPEVDPRRVETMLEGVAQEVAASGAIAEAEQSGLDALRQVRDVLGDAVQGDPVVTLKLLFAFRGHEAWPDMMELVEVLPTELSGTILVREQLALALSRSGRFSEAAEILKQVARDRPSSESYGLLGGVYKRQWLNAVHAGRPVKANALLKLAEETYRSGFETDWRDPYPGVNAVTLRAVRGPHDNEFRELLQVVRYSVKRRLSSDDADYWDYATALQLSIIAEDFEGATENLRGVTTSARQAFETTAVLEALQLLRQWCQSRGKGAWLKDVEAEVSQIFHLPHADSSNPRQP